MGNEATGFRARIQKFGGVLSGMVMPNIGAFITWGTDYGNVFKDRLVSK